MLTIQIKLYITPLKTVNVLLGIIIFEVNPISIPFLQMQLCTWENFSHFPQKSYSQLLHFVHIFFLQGLNILSLENKAVKCSQKFASFQLALLHRLTDVEFDGC